MSGIQNRTVVCLHSVTEEPSDECLERDKPNAFKRCQNSVGGDGLMVFCRSPPAAQFEVAAKNKKVANEKKKKKECFGDTLSYRICKRYLKLCATNARLRRKCCKTCDE